MIIPYKRRVFEQQQTVPAPQAAEPVNFNSPAASGLKSLASGLESAGQLTAGLAAQQNQEDKARAAGAAGFAQKQIGLTAEQINNMTPEQLQESYHRDYVHMISNSVTQNLMSQVQNITQNWVPDKFGHGVDTVTAKTKEIYDICSAENISKLSKGVYKPADVQEYLNSPEGQLQRQQVTMQLAEKYKAEAAKNLYNLAARSVDQTFQLTNFSQLDPSDPKTYNAAFNAVIGQTYRPEIDPDNQQKLRDDTVKRAANMLINSVYASESGTVTAKTLENINKGAYPWLSEDIRSDLRADLTSKLTRQAKAQQGTTQAPGVKEMKNWFTAYAVVNPRGAQTIYEELKANKATPKQSFTDFSAQVKNNPVAGFYSYMKLAGQNKPDYQTFTAMLNRNPKAAENLYSGLTSVTPLDGMITHFDVKDLPAFLEFFNEMGQLVDARENYALTADTNNFVSQQSVIVNGMYNDKALGTPAPDTRINDIAKQAADVRNRFNSGQVYGKENSIKLQNYINKYDSLAGYMIVNDIGINNDSGSLALAKDLREFHDDFGKKFDERFIGQIYSRIVNNPQVQDLTDDNIRHNNILTAIKTELNARGVNADAILSDGKLLWLTDRIDKQPAVKKAKNGVPYFTRPIFEQPIPANKRW